jgi:hypothetical protein
VGDINAETWSSRVGVGCKTDGLMAVLCQKSYKIQRNVTSKEGCGNKRAVSPMMMMMMMIF